MELLMENVMVLDEWSKNILLRVELLLLGSEFLKDDLDKLIEDIKKSSKEKKDGNKN